MGWLNLTMQISDSEMPGGKTPRFTQKPSIKQTAEGHLLMECAIEAQPIPTIRWFHGTELMQDGGRLSTKLVEAGPESFTASLLIKVV